MELSLHDKVILSFIFAFTTWNENFKTDSITVYYNQMKIILFHHLKSCFLHQMEDLDVRYTSAQLLLIIISKVGVQLGLSRIYLLQLSHLCTPKRQELVVLQSLHPKLNHQPPRVLLKTSRIKNLLNSSKINW